LLNILNFFLFSPREGKVWILELWNREQEQIFQLLDKEIQLINKLRETVISISAFYALFRTIIGCNNTGQRYRRVGSIVGKRGLENP